MEFWKSNIRFFVKIKKKRNNNLILMNNQEVDIL